MLVCPDFCHDCSKGRKSRQGLESIFSELLLYSLLHQRLFLLFPGWTAELGALLGRFQYGNVIYH